MQSAGMGSPGWRIPENGPMLLEIGLSGPQSVAADFVANADDKFVVGDRGVR